MFNCLWIDRYISGQHQTPDMAYSEIYHVKQKRGAEISEYDDYRNHAH